MGVVSVNIELPDQPSPDRAPNCLQCRHFLVTWNPRFPRACRMFNVKSRRLPSIVVFEATGRHCPAFDPVR